MEPVDGRAVLGRSRDADHELELKAEGRAVRHMGPMAQDFYRAFGLGEDDRQSRRSIPTESRWRRSRG